MYGIWVPSDGSWFMDNSFVVFSTPDFDVAKVQLTIVIRHFEDAQIRRFDGKKIRRNNGRF